jgi:hypothetical protein
MKSIPVSEQSRGKAARMPLTRAEWRPPGDVPEPAVPEEIPPGRPEEPAEPPPQEVPPGPSEVPEPLPRED